MAHILTNSEIDQLRAFMHGLLLGRPDLLIGDGANNPMLLLDSHEELASILAELVMVEESMEVTRHASCFHADSGLACDKTPPALVRARAALAAMQRPGRLL